MGLQSNNSIDLSWEEFMHSHRKSDYQHLYLHFYPLLYSYGKTISTNADLIDCSIQELFIRIWARPPKGILNINAYLFRAFRNQLIKDIQAEKRKDAIHDSVSNQTISVQHSPETQLIEEEKRSEVKLKIKSLLESMPQRRREAIFLKFFERKTTREISEIMNIREEMVRNYIHKGIKHLRANHQSELHVLYALCSFVMAFTYFQFTFF